MKTIQLRVSDEEHDEFKQKATESGLTLTEFVKGRCIGERKEPGLEERLGRVERQLAEMRRSPIPRAGEAIPVQKPPSKPRPSEPARTTKPLTVRPPATSGPVTSSMADLAASAALKPAAGVRYYCRVKECDFSAPSPKAKCSTHSGELITAEKKESL